MDKELLDRITETMIDTDDVKNAGITMDSLDKDTQTEILKKLLSNQKNRLKALGIEYEEAKRKYPDLHIAILEPHRGT
jgi:hypothetical protein